MCLFTKSVSKILRQILCGGNWLIFMISRRPLFSNILITCIIIVLRCVLPFWMLFWGWFWTIKINISNNDWSVSNIFDLLMHSHRLYCVVFGPLLCCSNRPKPSHIISSVDGFVAQMFVFFSVQSVWTSGQWGSVNHVPFAGICLFINCESCVVPPWGLYYKRVITNTLINGPFSGPLLPFVQ